ncbi:unnamed protein product, partial [Nesidiocoris tenuis]
MKNISYRRAPCARRCWYSQVHNYSQKVEEQEEVDGLDPATGDVSLTSARY